LSNNWQLLIPVSAADDIQSTNPALIATPTKVWVFWEEGDPADIYYRIWTINGWENDPTAVYINPVPSSAPRAFYNTMNPEIVYVVWSEYDNVNAQWDIYCSDYYNGWQSPVNISNTPNADSKDPDITYIPSLMEGKLVIPYAEGNEHWSSRGKFLPLYWVRTYVTNLPLGGGGPQARGESKCNILFSVNPNPFRDRTDIRCQIPDTRYKTTDKHISDITHLTSVSLKIYDATGRLVRQWDNETIRQSDQIIWSGDDDLGRKVPAGVYFVQFEAGDYKKVEKAVLLR